MNVVYSPLPFRLADGTDSHIDAQPLIHSLPFGLQTENGSIFLDIADIGEAKFLHELLELISPDVA